MLPFLPLLSQLLPGVTGIIAGDHTGSALERMADAIKELTKKDKEEDAHAAVEADPALKLQVQSKLAEIALEETKEQNRAKEEQQRIELDLTRLEADERERARQNEFQTYLRD